MSEVQATPERVDVDDLLDRYLKEAQVEVAAEQQEKRRLRAAFEAGAPLVLLQPADLWDPIDQRMVRVAGGTVVTVAEHEGDVLIGKLADNSHSIGVVYEEPERWYPRKYFLPLAILVDRLRVNTDDPQARARAQAGGLPVKGMAERGVDAHTAVAVRRIEELALRDEYATLPRGTLLVLRRGAVARDADGAEVPLPPGTRAEVSEAVGDFANPADPVAADIPIVVDGRALKLGFDQLLGLDFKTDVLNPRAQEALRGREIARREALRRIVGVGVGVAFVAGGAAWYVSAARADPGEARRGVLTALIPEIAFLHGYFRAGGKYWFDLRGVVMDLQASSSLEPARRLRDQLRDVASRSDALNRVYASTYWRSVHVGWSETRHYRTDDKGNREYTHSTWTPVYAQVWCEPPGLRGFSGTVADWAAADGQRHRRAVRLVDERVYNLLAADADDPEKDFALQKQMVGFGRDAALSALSAALLALPAAFYDDIGRWIGGSRRTEPPPEYIPYQKDALLLAGVVSGAVLAHRHARKLDAQLRQNKYDLGQQLEAQIRRVPTLDLDAAWAEFFGAPDTAALPGELAARAHDCQAVAGAAIDFTFVYGSGWDNGRPLTPTFIDSGPVRAAFAQGAPAWAPVAERLRRFLSDPGHRAALLPLLRNAVGTEILDRQMKQDRSEASGGGLRNAAWFALPLWGAAVLDGLLKATRR